jgi:hypothetical protein
MRVAVGMALAGITTGGRLVAAVPGMGGRPAGEWRLTMAAGASMPRTLQAGSDSYGVTTSGGRPHRLEA